MTSLYAVYRGELSKLLSRKKYIVFLIIGAIICLIWAVLGSVASDLIVRQVGFLIPLTPTPMGVLPFFLQILLPFFIFMGVTDLITAESSEHTMKAMLYRPVERFKLYAGKLLAVLSYAVMYLICVFFVSLVLHQIFGRGLALSDVANSIAAYTLTILPLAVLTTFAAFIALFGRSSTMTMFLLVIIYLVMSVSPIISPIMAEILFTSYLGWHRVWIGITPGFSRIVRMLLILFGYGVVFFTAGSLIFDRKEY